jgi:hypothetical protein
MDQIEFGDVGRCLTKIMACIVLVEFSNANTWVVRDNLALDEALQMGGHPNQKANLAINGSNLETEVLLNSPLRDQFPLRAENAVEADEKFFGSGPLLIVGTRYLEGENLVFEFPYPLGTTMILNSQVEEDDDNW